MSDYALSVLLPAATVDVFVLDDKTLKVLEKVAADWRFARVQIRAEKKTIEEATTLYEQEASASLVIVETDDIGDGFVDKLDALAGNCEEDTSAIVIGPKNDVNLYRNLIGMGVSDYLVKPLSFDGFVEVIAKTLIDKVGLSKSRLIAVTGCRGGVGVTSISETLASIISREFKLKTMLMDAAGGWGSQGVVMGFEATSTLQSALTAAKSGAEDDLKRMVHHYDGYLDVLACGGDGLLDFHADEEAYETLLEYFMQTYPVVVVDLSGAETDLVKHVLELAHEVVVVSTPSLVSLRSARILYKEIKGMRGGAAKSDDEIKDVHLVINMQGHNAGLEVSKADIKTTLECEPDAIIGYNAKAFVGAEQEGKTVYESGAGKKHVETLIPLAQKLANWHGKSEAKSSEGGALGSLLSKIKSK